MPGARYDGEQRNPWDEAECGHHYARAMSAWSAMLALSGFRYHGGRESVSMLPRRAPASSARSGRAAPAWGDVYRKWRTHHAAVGPWDAGVPFVQRSRAGRGGQGDGQPEGGRSQTGGWRGHFPGPGRAPRR